jgi:hypothetical protein
VPRLLAALQALAAISPDREDATPIGSTVLRPTRATVDVGDVLTNDEMNDENCMPHLTDDDARGQVGRGARQLLSVEGALTQPVSICRVLCGG